FVFFFQAEDGIRDYKVTGVQTCAIPIYAVVIFLAVISSVVTGGLQRQRRKLFVGAFRFLQTNNIGRSIFEPREQSILTFAQRIRSEERRVGKECRSLCRR